jgi:hypothetical protein
LYFSFNLWSLKVIILLFRRYILNHYLLMILLLDFHLILAPEFTFSFFSLFILLFSNQIQ